MAADLSQPPWIEQLAPTHDHGDGVNEQGKTVADCAIKSEQQRQREDELGDAQDVRARRRKRHSVKITGMLAAALGRISFSMLHAAEKSRETRAGPEARVECVCRVPATFVISLAEKEKIRLTTPTR